MQKSRSNSTTAKKRSPSSAMKATVPAKGVCASTKRSSSNTAPKSRSSPSTKTSNAKATTTATTTTSSSTKIPSAPTHHRTSAAASAATNNKKKPTLAPPFQNEKNTPSTTTTTPPPAEVYPEEDKAVTDAVVDINFKAFPLLMEPANIHDERDAHKWNLLLDPSGKADTFMRYRNANYFDVADPAMMNDPEVLRRLIVGAIRFQKCLVINVRDLATISDFVKEVCDKIEKELWDRLWDKQRFRSDVEYIEEKLYKEAIDNPPGFTDTVVFTKDACCKFVLLLVASSAKTVEVVDPAFLKHCNVYRTDVAAF